MTASPEQIESEIAQTREEIKTDVDALSEKLDPRKAAGRQAGKVKDSVTAAKDALMGTAESTKETITGTTSDVASRSGDRVGEVTGTVREAPARIASRTSGNPWAMGLGAFALGWLVSSLIPASRKEREAAQQLKESPIVEKAAESARQVASEAGEQVKAAASSVAEQAKEAGAQVGQQAKEAGTSVGQHAKETVSTTS
jgi:hypothetical protein